MYLLGLLLVGNLVACVLPPDLSVQDQDDLVNSPPAITAVRSDDQELPEPGPVYFERGLNAGTMSISLIDTDVEDLLFVRIYVEYYVNDPRPARIACDAPPTGTALRTASCDLMGLCQANEVNLAKELFMTVQVFDRPLLTSGAPLYKHMQEGGLSTSRSYLLNCSRPPS